MSRSEPVIFHRHWWIVRKKEKKSPFVDWNLGSQWPSVKKSNKIQSRISCIFTINLICQTPLHCCLFKIAVNLIFPFTMRTIYIGLPLKMTLKEHQEWRCLLLCLSMYVEKLCQESGPALEVWNCGCFIQESSEAKKGFLPYYITP